MSCIGDYLENTVIYDRNLHGINELAGQIELGRLSLTSLLSIHAIISESEQLEDLATLKLLNIVYLHISERLSFVPKGRPFGQYIYTEEAPCLCLKHVLYAKKLLLNNFERKLRLAGKENLSVLYRLFYDRIVDLFIILSNCCMKQNDDVTCSFSLNDLKNALEKQGELEENSKYINEIKKKVILELEDLKFLNNLSNQNVWQGIKSLLAYLKTQKQPFGFSKP